MLFNSYIFILLFLPLTFGGWHILNHLRAYTAARLYLVGMSLWFYAYFNIKYLPLILISMAGNFLCYRLMTANRNWDRPAFWGGVFLNLGLLFYYKYFDFFVENINTLTGSEFALRHLLLPLGISFFTFQQLGFLIDTKNGVGANYGLVEYALFVTFFPQLIAGPIVTHDEMILQFRAAQERGLDVNKVAAGLYCFIMGLGKKVLIADVVGRCVDTVCADFPFKGGALAAILAMSCYSIQIYFDFSGYCDMATGIGLLFGVVLPPNFNSPYISRSPVEFWKRWHLTLGRFLTKFVYIPLGGSRKGVARSYVNILIVFILSGIWHGAGWNYVLWGFLHGIAQVGHKVLGRFVKPLKNPPVLVLAVFIFLNLVYYNIVTVIFWAGSIPNAMTVFSALAPGANWTMPITNELTGVFRTPELFYLLKVMTRQGPEMIDRIIMVMYTVIPWCLIFFTPNLYSITVGFEEGHEFRPTVVKALACSVVFLWSLVSLSSVSSFLYFNF